MKANEIQIGDLIQNTNGNIGRVIGFQFDLASESNEVVMRYHSNSTCWSGTKILRPIPLTPEILEKNGFMVAEQASRNLLMVKRDEGYVIEVYLFQKNCVFEVWNSYFLGKQYGTDHSHKCGIYVHELQRALRCCELWDLADNFIVE